MNISTLIKSEITVQEHVQNCYDYCYDNLGVVYSKYRDEELERQIFLLPLLYPSHLYLEKEYDTEIRDSDVNIEVRNYVHKCLKDANERIIHKLNKSSMMVDEQHGQQSFREQSPIVPFVADNVPNWGLILEYCILTSEHTQDIADCCRVLSQISEIHKCQ